jgi:hypothetical protein
LAAGTVAITAVAIWLRLLPLDGAVLDGDSFHVWERGLAVLGGGPLPWRGEGEGFHYGAAQVYLTLPLLAAAGGLRGAIAATAVLHGLGTVPLALAGRRLGSPALGLVAALLYASWPMLAAHPAAGSNCYLAPPLVAIAVWAVVRSLDGAGSWAAATAGASLALAVAMHPFALATAGGALVLTPWVVRVGGRRSALWGGVVFVAVAAPMVADNALLRLAEPERAASYALIGEAGWWGLLVTGPLEACWGWPRPLALAVLASPLAALAALASSTVRRAAGPGPALVAWALASAALLLSAGLFLRYLRPYHLGVVAPLLLLACGWALTTAIGGLIRPRPALAAVGWCGLALGLLASLPATVVALRPPDSPGQLHLASVEEAATAIAGDAAGRTVALALVADTASCAHGQLGAYQAQLRMGGVDVIGGTEAPSHARRLARAYVIAEMEPAAWSAWGTSGVALVERTTGEGTTLRVLAFRDVATAERWLIRGCPLLPDHPDLRISRLRRSLGGMPGSDEDPATRETRGELVTFCDVAAP